MIPTPTHLVKCTHQLDEKEIEDFKVRDRYPGGYQSQFIGKVKCTCGCETFDLLFPGEENEYGPCVTEVGGEYFFIIRAKCSDCGKEHLLFDDDFHGWNGWICHDNKKASQPRPELIEWKCKNCGDTKHKIVIFISSQGKEDFIEEAGEEFDVERWQDAFDWISFDIKCEGCGETKIDFISHETM